MRVTEFESIGTDCRTLWLHMQRLIGASYLIDVLVLGGFAAVHLVAGWVAPAYAAAGLLCWGTFNMLIRSGYTLRFVDSSLALPQLVGYTALELGFIIMVPAATLYFLGLICVIFAFASLRLRPMDAVLAWSGVSVGVILAVWHAPGALAWVPALPAQRLALAAGFVLALGRCTWIGLYGNRLRARLRKRHEQMRDSLKELTGRNVAMSIELHEDLGQQLAGVSLILAAASNRLRRDNHPVADDLEDAAAHLGDSIIRVRALASGAAPLQDHALDRVDVDAGGESGRHCAPRKRA